MRRESPKAVLLLTLASACARGGAAVPDAAPAEAAVTVQAAQVTDTALARPVVAAGTVAPRDEVTLAFKVGGPIATLGVDEGESVRAGQRLATLALDETDAALARSDAGAEKAERDLARARRLYADSVVTLAQLEDAETAARIARAGVRAAALDRRYAEIVAPFDGVVLRRSADPGQIAAAGAPVLVLGSRGRGEVVRVSLSDRDAAAIRLGDPATVRFTALAGAEVEGMVSRIAAAADPATGTFGVEIAVRGAGSLMTGMVGEAAIRPRRAVRTRLVPLAALVEADGATGAVFALSADGRHAERRTVRLGAIDGGAVAVLGGLDGVARVVTGGAAYLADRAAVRVTP
jgi:RND family efflux transporter MFP subunit